VLKNIEIALAGCPDAEKLANKALKAVGMNALAHSRGNRLSEAKPSAWPSRA
jgi:hypothetical protein